MNDALKLTPKRLRVLNCLSLDHPATISDARRAVGPDCRAADRFIRPLISAGLARQDGRDRYFLTPEGSAARIGA